MAAISIFSKNAAPGALRALAARFNPSSSILSTLGTSSNPVSGTRFYGSPPPPLPLSNRQRRLMIRNSEKVYRENNPTPSLETSKKDHFDDAVYDDIGLMPETFIMPTGIDKPSIISQPKIRLVMEWHRVKSKVLMVIRSLFLKWFQTKGMNPPLKLDWFNLSSIATDLYTQMNTGFAAGNGDKISKAVTPGLHKVLTRRLTRRGDVRLKWEFSSPPKARLILDTITKLPYEGPTSPIVGENVHLMRQAVVKIVGDQSLEQGELVDPLNSSKVTWDRLPVIARVPEYIVIQQRVLRGKTEPWKIWGMTRETSLEAFQDMRQQQGHRSSEEKAKATEGLL